MRSARRSGRAPYNSSPQHTDPFGPGRGSLPRQRTQHERPRARAELPNARLARNAFIRAASAAYNLPITMLALHGTWVVRAEPHSAAFAIWAERADHAAAGNARRTPAAQQDEAAAV